MPPRDRPGRRTRLRLGALALASLAGIAACQWLVPLNADGPPAKDAGPGPAESCGPVPPPPAAVVDAGDNAPEITFAAYYLGYDKGDAGFLCDNSGVNLDGLVSGGPSCTPAACTAPGDAGTNKAACDGPNGADNALGYLLAQSSLAVGTNLDAFSLTTAVQRGVLNLLFQIQSYNGLPDDDDVQVVVWTSSGITGLAPDGGGFSYQDIARLPEVWDGGQEDIEWTVDERSALITPPVISSRVRKQGYVKDEILVVPNTGPLALPPLFGSSLSISDGILTGHVFRDTRGRWQLTFGRIAARAESASLLGVLGRAKVGGPSDTPLCDPTNLLYPSIRRLLCASLDLPPNGGPADPAATCGALSLGFALAAVESKIATDGGHVVTGESRLHGTPLCVDADAGTVFCDDCSWDAASMCDAGSGR